LEQAREGFVPLILTESKQCLADVVLCSRLRRSHGTHQKSEQWAYHRLFPLKPRLPETGSRPELGGPFHFKGGSIPRKQRYSRLSSNLNRGRIDFRSTWPAFTMIAQAGTSALLVGAGGYDRDD
jgi:hypothetical protein